MTRTPILAGLFALVASAALAQTNAGNLGGMNLDPGSSGSNAGLLSGGGAVSSSLHANDPRAETNARVKTPRAEAKGDSGSDTKIRSNSGTKASAKADTDDDPVSDKSRGKLKAAKEKKEAAIKEKERKTTRLYSYPYVYSRGFAAFGYPRWGY